jgi:hypothetical protein
MAPLCCVASLLALLLTATPVISPQTASDAPLDVAAMTLLPADLAAVGWDDLGIVAGQSLGAENLADRAVWPQGAGPEQDAVRDALLAAGWRQGYAASFATFWDPNRSDPGRQLELEVIAYADEAGAARGFALVPDAYPTGPITAIPGTHRVGEESRAARVAARDPQAGTPAQELVFGFRHGRLTARFLLRDWSGEEPAVAAAEALAIRLQARIERVLKGDGPGLSLLAVRPEPREGAFQSEYYARLDGQDVRSTYESPDEFADRVAAYGAATDVFTWTTEIAASDRDDPIRFDADLYRFPNPAQASDWWRAGAARMGQEDDVAGFAIDDQLAGIGDEALGVTVARDPGGDGLEVAHMVAVNFRVGAVVAAIRLTRSNDPPPLAAATEIAAAQAACLATTDCLHP